MPGACTNSAGRASPMPPAWSGSRGSSRTTRGGGVHWIDAREIVWIDAAPLGPTVLWPESRANADSLIPQDADATLVITGFIAGTRDGLQTTLGRNGSDFSASIFGALLDASD